MNNGGQNLNQYISDFHSVCVTHCTLIDHVFYEPGHSQQVGDSMHSATIERTSKKRLVHKWSTKEAERKGRSKLITI